MKAFSTLLSIYILFLVSVPCVDDIRGCEQLNTKTELMHTAHHHDTQHDSCSPFCVCSCCNVTIVLTHNVFEAQPLSTVEFKVIPFYQESISCYFNHIWQPPKLV